ncbi:hypothetical protein [Stackebrandtia soli]|uniref:hypothetical protein n=1 Tax=Stackebrandtia soli TaxID=1892856 RepID=UPI0039EA414B
MTRDDAKRVPVDDEPLLPEQTSDDTDEGWSPPRRRSAPVISAEDQRLLDERPPHWG